MPLLNGPKGSTIALRSDLAANLREWIKGRDRSETVFNVPAGILRIMNRDLTAAGIDKTDADGCVIHVHALRHSFGTHLSRAGVSPRVAQAAMRHSDIALTMNTYTDARLLDTAEAVESLSIARDNAQRTVAPMVAPNLVQQEQIQSVTDHSDEAWADGEDTEKPCQTLGLAGFDAVGATRFELATSTSRTFERCVFGTANRRTKPDTAELMHQWMHQLRQISKSIHAHWNELSEDDRVRIRDAFLDHHFALRSRK